MEDLSGLSWSSTSQKPPANSMSQHQTLRPTPSPSLSRQGTPNPPQQSGSSPRVGSSPSMASRIGPSSDSFANLLAPQSTKPASAISLQEKQKQLLAERARQAEEQKKRYHDQYHTNDNSIWEGLGSGRGTPNPAEQMKRAPTEDEDDILAAFDASAPVDAASHFPPPRSSTTESHTSKSPDRNLNAPRTGLSNGYKANQVSPIALQDDDDDPFGLGGLPQQPTRNQPQMSSDEGDDILGMLGKPVSEVRAQRDAQKKSQANSSNKASSTATKPKDAALAELMDMGFPTEKAQQALSQTDSGSDVQAAVGWLLNQAHQDSRAKSKSSESRAQDTRAGSRKPEPIDSRRAQGGRDQNVPAWARHPGENGRRNSQQSPGSADFAQAASEFGNNLFKSANTLWKTGQKRMQKAVAELQHEGDSSTPRWMREGQNPPEPSQVEQVPSRPNKAQPTQQQTDEAILLDSGRRPSPPRSSRKSDQRRRISDPRSSEVKPQRRETDLATRPASRPNPTELRTSSRPTERISRQAIEEQSSQAYVSPARRKKQPAPQSPPKDLPTEDSLDIFSNQAPPPTRTPSSRPSITSSKPTSESRTPTPVQVRPKTAPRKAPSVSPASLSASNSARQKGSEAFKRGDYGDAQSSYSKALTSLPQGHPITIVILCNRALTNIKVGEPKSAITDADAALSIIGPSRGDNESILLSDTEGSKPMSEFFGKALMRKAEALEHMEKWSEASKIWHDAVEAGVGGAVSIQGRNRCDKASGKVSQPPKTSAVTTSKRPPVKKPTPVPKTSALQDLHGGPASESGAVKRLRDANAAAAKASDEAFALNDSVEARISGWKSGKSDNLRALLASLDTVLWPDAGWKKVGMGDLVLPPKVKIVYMKAIAKVHPDKISQQATTEQRMVSGAVFATLNEAWDKFKKDNGL